MRKYKYDNRWMDYSELHLNYGFTRYPTETTQGYKSTLDSSWGEQRSSEGYLDKHDSTDINNWQFYIQDSHAWVDINHLVSDYNLYPADGIDTIVMNDTRTSKAILYLAYIEDRVELWYLIKNDLSLGWVKDSDLSIHGYSGSYLPIIESYSEVPLTTVINNGSLTTRIPYSSSKLYSYMVIPQGNNTVQYDGWEIGNDNGYLSLTNKTGEDVYVVLILFKVVNKSHLRIVRIQNNTTGDLGDAYIYTNVVDAKSWYTPVWYGLDWVVDLSDLGFSLLPEIWHDISYLDPTQTPVNIQLGFQPLFNSYGDNIYYNEDAQYESIRYYVSESAYPIYATGVYVGPISGYYELMIKNNTETYLTAQRVEYVEYFNNPVYDVKNPIKVITVYDSNNSPIKALWYYSIDQLFYVLDGIHNAWVKDISSIGYSTICNPPQVGDIVLFGKYPQTHSTVPLSDDYWIEPIEWVVLDVDTDNNRLLMISKNVLDCQKYNSEDTGITWENCTLRVWLNSSFLTTAFNSDEIEKIVSVYLPNYNNPSYNTPGGNATYDRIFCLSIQEASKSEYFVSDNARRSIPTTKAINAGVYVENGYAQWWLRSPGVDPSIASYVLCNGGVDGYGLLVDNTEVGVRPVMWITYN